MTTQKFMGRHSLVKRLTAQVGDEGMAIAILKKRGQMSPSGQLTAEGRRRDNMTAAERAKDRAAKASNHKPSAFTYHAKDNRAVLKK